VIDALTLVKHWDRSSHDVINRRCQIKTRGYGDVDDFAETRTGEGGTEREGVAV